MLKSKVQYLIEGFEAMNISMLEVVLDDYRTYQEARKDVFLKKIAAAFENHKESGDTCLMAYFGTCKSTQCENKGCTGYSFVGNTSHKHIDLIVKTENGEIVDLFNCNGLVTEYETVKRKELQFINIRIDELASFQPSVEMLIKFQEVDLAYAEIMAYNNFIIGKEIYLPWLNKHEDLYKYSHDKFFLFNRASPFRSLFYSLSHLKDFLAVDKNTEEAVIAFEHLNTNIENELLRWLVKYEYIIEALTLFLYDEIDFEFPEKKEFFTIHGFKILTADFKYIATFKFYSDNYYWDMLEKYSTFTFEEKKKWREEGADEAANISSLTFHLKKRGIIF